MRTPRVSVVIPVLNGARTIRDSVESVKQQTRPADEIIVVWAPSSDGTEAELKSIDGIKAIRQQSKGMPQGFNEGIRAATGDFIAFNGDDDIWLPEKISAQLALFAEDASLACVTCKMKYFSDDPSKIPRGFRGHLLNTTVPANNCEGMMAQKSLFEELGDFNTSMYGAFDVEFFARLNDSGRSWKMVDRLLVRKRVHERSAHLADTKRNTGELMDTIAASLARKRANRNQGT